ncbi:putative alkaline phosphatase [Lupinus albus]|uniref:Putative alkaline phosphatase n=1 Tax=Lupinus albus TaxID=3870 RepID=A0A6A4PWW3_LUPAL|nr:putative alkaline phosphatase [Lupinus albus]
MGLEQRQRQWRWCVVVFMVMITITVSVSDTHTKQVSRIAFGSCSNQSAPQPIWEAVLDFHPQIFIWLGDNIYGDIKRPFKLFGRERTIGPWKNAPRFIPSSEEEMEAKYRKAKSNPGYAQLKENAEVIGTWDDHDYGLNDAGKEFHRKIINQKLLLDFLDEPQDSPRRKQAGVYASYKYGPAGRDVQIILLDTRYHRDPLGSDGTILGNSQWSWLERELKGSSAAITVIGSSIQVISNLSATVHPLFSMESWAHFPRERDRLFKLIADSKRGGVFFISGDVHFGEITRYDCAVDYPLYDVTSSGVTQSVEGVVPPFLHFLVRSVAWLTPSTMRVKGPNCRYKSCVYGQPNFGTIEIDWDSHPVTLKLKVRDENGIAVTGINTSLVELQASNSEDSVKVGHDRRHCTLEVSLPWIIRYRLTILVSITLAVLLLVFIGLVYTAITVFLKGVCKRKQE